MALEYRSKRRRGHHHRFDPEHYCRFCWHFDGVLKRLPRGQSINGAPFRPVACNEHACYGPSGGVPCPNIRFRREIPFCEPHLFCTHNGCHRRVINDDPKTFRLCSHHACRAPGCGIRRDGESDFCTAHKCIRTGCDERRHPTGRSQFCVKHTCEDGQCCNQVHYEGDVPAGDQRRFCNAHKRCGRDGCARLCHMHDDGSLSPFCGDHRCHWRACGTEQAAGSQFCEAHRCTCSYAVCLNGWANEHTRFCEGHKCSREGCHLPRHRLLGLGSTFCEIHKCRDPDCVKEVHQESGWCERHLPCATEGCNNRRKMDGERVTDHCEQHTPPTCAWERPARCNNPARANGQFCVDHTCTAADCLDARDTRVPRSVACEIHRCTAGAGEQCGRLRAPYGHVAANMYLPGQTSYCWRHGCNVPGCMSEAIENTPYCRQHLCAVNNCRGRAIAHGRRLCEEHAEIREESIRSTVRRPRGIPPIAPVYEVPPPPAPYGVVPPVGGGYGYGMPIIPGGVVPRTTYSYGPGHQRTEWNY